VSALRSYASVGSISGAPKVVTSTGSSGMVVVSTSFPPSVSETSASSTTTGNSVSHQKSLYLGKDIVANSDIQTSTFKSSSRTSTVTATNLSSSSSGFAQATQAPVVAAMGVLGLLGVIAAL
jgi:hypothetical protein